MSFEKNYSVQYSDLKKAIYKSISYGSENSDLEFSIDSGKIAKYIKENDLGVTMVSVGLQGKDVRPEDIPLIYEYFKGDKIAWFEKHRAFTSLLFVVNDSLDDAGRDIINTINNAEGDYAQYIKKDMINLTAKLIANYSCCTALVVSYITNNPDSKHKNNLTISIRANNIMINQNKKENNTEVAAK